MENKTKILAVGDLHGNTRLIEKLAERADKEILVLIILDEALPLFLFGFMNLLIFFRRKRFFSRL